MFRRFLLISLLFWTFSSFGNDKRSINNYEWTYRLLLINSIDKKTTSLDQLLKNKYQVQLNQKTIDRVKNYFK